jgi:hypothetical protein
MTMNKQVTLSAIVLIGLFTAACTSSSQAGLGFRATATASGAAVATTAASGSASPITTQPEATPSQGQLLAPPSLAPNRCPPVTANPISANPIGCPGPLPPQPIVPQTGHARVLLCTQPIAFPPIAVGTLVCGVGFRPEELVTVTVSGRTGTASWQVTTGRDGSFRSMLAPAACRLMPAYLSARGNRGSVSNALPLTLVSCRRIP